MATIYWGPGLHPACGFLEPGHTVDCQLLRKLKSDIRDKRPDIDMNVTIHHDNARNGRQTCETVMDSDPSPAVQP